MGRITKDLLNKLGISLSKFKEKEVKEIENIIVVDEFTDYDKIRVGTPNKEHSYPTHTTKTGITLPDIDVTAREYLLRERLIGSGDFVKGAISIGDENVNDHVAYVVSIMTMGGVLRRGDSYDIPSYLVGYRVQAIANTSDGALILETDIATDKIEDASTIITIISNYLGRDFKTEQDFSVNGVCKSLQDYDLSIDKMIVSKLKDEKSSSPVKISDLSQLNIYADVCELVQECGLNASNKNVAKVGTEFVKDFEKATRNLIRTPTMIQVSTDNLILGDKYYTLNRAGRASPAKGRRLYCELK